MSSDPYPLPSFAVSLWLAGDKVMIGMPPLDGNQQGHTVEIPLERLQVVCDMVGKPLPSQRGLAILIDMLKERARVGRQPISTLGEPTQHTVEQILNDRWNGVRPKHYSNAGHEVHDLSELGLD